MPRWQTTLTLICALALPHFVAAWVAPIIMKNYKLFDSNTNTEFRIKGMAYYPRANGGNMSGVTGYDYTTDDHESIWKPHLDQMKDLGVNVIRLYAVDPSKSHDKFMCQASQYGIYVLVGMAAPCLGCHISDEPPPGCYSSDMFTRAMMIYNAFAVYDNTLAFSVGNENNLQSGTTVTAPCVKALIRDIKNYAYSCSEFLRHVPIGLDLADIAPRASWLQFYDCSVDTNEFSRADWIGFNPYVECDPVSHQTYSQSTGLQSLMKEYKDSGYSRPIMLGEFGCNLGQNTVNGFENQRTFHDAKWMNEEPEMTDIIVGGNVFEFTTEIANTVAHALGKTKDVGRYGVGFFQPDDCDHWTKPCVFNKYPEYDNLKLEYTTTKASTLTISDFKPTRDNILTCPKTLFATNLPPMPTAKILACAIAKPVCDGNLSNNFKKTGTFVKMGNNLPPTNALGNDIGTRATNGGTQSVPDSHPAQPFGDPAATGGAGGAGGGGKPVTKSNVESPSDAMSLVQVTANHWVVVVALVCGLVVI